MSSTNYSPTYQAAASSAATDEGLQILSAFYTRTYPSADELAVSLDQFTEGELDEVVTELRNEVAALREETEAMRHQVDDLRGSGAADRPGQSSKNDLLSIAGLGARDDGVESTGAQTPSKAMSASTSNVTVSGASASAAAGVAASSSAMSGGSGGTRRGQRYRRKSATMGDLVQYVRVDDKMKLLEMEMDRVRLHAAEEGREMEHVTASLVATAEEASRRMKELRIEVMQLHRDVLDPETGEATADELVRYLHRRELAQNSYLDKILTQCQSSESDIRRAQAQARQRQAAGEAFQPIDFDQLRIENQQFTERLDKKNTELASLKAMSTRTVQSLNALTDALNAITAEQARLKRESKSRSEYLTRCQQDVQVATKEAAQAERKNTAIKSQQEAVKVPKIEEYIAQKAELYELEKAVNNWLRKVEIAEGQVGVVRQQKRALMQQQRQVADYAGSRLLRGRGSRAAAAVRGRGAAAVTRASANTGLGVQGGGLDARGGAVVPRARPRGGAGAAGGSGAAASAPAAYSASAGSSVVDDGVSPRYIPHTPSAGEAATAAAGGPPRRPKASTPLAGQSNSSVGLSSQVLVGGAGKAVLEARRAATPPVASEAAPQADSDAQGGEEDADVVAE